MNWNFGIIPELYKEVEILFKDGTTGKDMMIKGKYGNYEWRNYKDRAVLGWREITENKTNTKENKTMRKSRENRMEALKAANIETGKYFSVTLPEGLKPGSTINVTISEDGSPVVLNPSEKKTELTPEEQAFVNQVYNDGYVRNTRLHRRWIMAQMFRMLNYKSPVTDKSGYDAYLNERYGYQYQFDIMLQEVKVLTRLKTRDREAFEERNIFFTPDVVISTCEDYIKKLHKHVEGLPVHKCKGIPYKKVFGENIFITDLQKKVFWPQERMLRDLKDIVDDMNKHPACYVNGSFYWGLRGFCSHMYKLPDKTPKCTEWKDAFKGEGSYYTLMNLIKFHGCRVVNRKTMEKMNMMKSINTVNILTVSYKGEYYRLFAFMKQVIEDNNFNFNKRMQELYPEKSA